MSRLNRLEKKYDGTIERSLNRIMHLENKINAIDKQICKHDKQIIERTIYSVWAKCSICGKYTKKLDTDEKINAFLKEQKQKEITKLEEEIKEINSR